MIRESVHIIRSIITRESNRGQKTRRLLRAMGWQIWKRTAKRPLSVCLPFNKYHFILHPDCVTSSNIVYFRDADFREAEFIRQRLHGGTLIDIGANVGLVTLSLADKIDHAILFEPNPLTARLAKENCEINSVSFDVYNMALSDNEGSLFLEDRGGPSGVNMVFRDPSLTQYQTHKIQCATLDHFMEKQTKNLPPLALIKVDVEGHEVEVFRGMKKTLSTMKPEMIMFEYLQRTDLSELQKILQTAGYQLFSLLDTQLAPLFGRPKPGQNLFALPQ